MNQEDIIRMAREAGAWPELSTTPEKDVKFLRCFAALVAAAENEACAKVCEDSVEYAGDELARQIRARGQA